MSSYYYKLTESSPDHRLYTVLIDTPTGVATDSDHSDREEAAKRVHYLNGGNAVKSKLPIICFQCGNVSGAYYRLDHHDDWRCADCYMIVGLRYMPEKLDSSGKITVLKNPEE